MSTSERLWTPSTARVQQSQMYAFMTQMAQAHGFTPEWPALHAWSVQHPEQFWPALLAYVQIAPSQPAEAAVRGGGMLGTTWFPGLQLNYARHLLRHDAATPALIAETELGRRREISWRELRTAVARCAAALTDAGVTIGDRVAGFMPNVPETIIAMLATASLGAVWSSCSPDFGVRGVLDRFGQIEPTVLIVTDGYTYGGKRFPTLTRIAEMLPQLPSVKQVVVVPYLDATPSFGNIPDALQWDEFLGPTNTPPPELTFTEVPFDHPLFIMYSSGTTGVPKCIVHGHGGTLLQHMKELMLHCDLRAGERIFYFTTCGWMMWNWLVSGLGVGATVVLYEGNPGYPTMQRLWQFAAEMRLNIFGTSAKYLAACAQADVHPGRDHDLSALRCTCSTGSPLSAELFHWTYAEVKEDLQLASISGGTDIVSCFVLGNPLLPVHAGEIQCAGLGMDVHAYDDAGQPVVNTKGELVCCTPFPAQPVYFWNDPDQSRYRAAYFEFYPQRTIWRHGDFIEIRDTGGIVVYGRSDATLNPGGVRIGTAEIYRTLENIPQITDSIVVGRDTPDGDIEVVLFVVLKPGVELDDELQKRLRAAIAAATTKRHVPRHIIAVPDVPYTISGKKVEMAVRRVLQGQEVPNRDALKNPEALDAFRNVL